MPKRYRVEYVLIDDESFDDADNNLSLDYIKEIAVPSNLDAGVSVDSVSVAEITTTPPDFTEQARQLVNELSNACHPTWGPWITAIASFASEAATAALEQAAQVAKDYIEFKGDKLHLWINKYGHVTLEQAIAAIGDDRK